MISKNRILNRDLKREYEEETTWWNYVYDLNKIRSYSNFEELDNQQNQKAKH